VSNWSVTSLLIALCLLLSPPALVQTRPDFSGAGEFDRDRTMKQPPSADGRLVIAAMLGDEFVASQDAGALHLTIKALGQTVNVTYNLDGSESRNISPGDIPVVSRASWEGNTLVILSTSTSTEKGKTITIETRRAIWLEKDGSLVIERTGTPASEVQPSKSIYKRVR
jgi:hypothetical protein